MSDIICRWLNVELRLSKSVAPRSFSKDFANGYLIGEILHKYQLQEDFDLFLKSNSASSKLNNFTRVEPTLKLLGVSLNLSMAVMQEEHGAATRLLYQLYLLLQKKKMAGLTGTAMEAMRPAGTAFLHRLENDIYRKVSEVGLPHQNMPVSFLHHCSTGSYLRAYVTSLPKQSIQAGSKRSALNPSSTLHFHSAHQTSSFHTEAFGSHSSQAPGAEETAAASSEYIQRIRRRLEEDSAARQQREKRRRRFLVQQLKAHEAQEEALREEQLVERLTRQSQQEKRLAVQLMQLRQQKEVILQNRLLRDKQHQERRQRDFQEALDRESALARQASLDHAEEIRKQMELHEVIAAGRVMARYRKHFDNCQGILEQIVDLVMKVGEYRLLTGNLIPMKMMREWKELFFRGKPLYDRGCLEELPADPTPEQVIEADKQEILNDQDYGDYTSMTGEWAWPEGEGPKPPPSVSNFLEHAVLRLHIMVNPPKPATPPPVFPRYTLKACVLGKPFSGKSTCLARIAQGMSSSIGCIFTLYNTLSHFVIQYHSGLCTFTQFLFSRCCNMNTLSTMNCPFVLTFALTSTVSPRAVPADSGWILDGFPVTLNQAKLLEKALGGSDAGKEGDWRDNRRGDLSLDSTAPKETPPPCPPVLDLALLLDVTDTQVLSRAAKQACKCHSPEQSDVTTRDQSLEERQIQHRITGFQDTWPKLEKWFSEKQSILVRLNAETSEDVLVEKVESVLYRAMSQAEKGTGKLSPSHFAVSTVPHPVNIKPREYCDHSHLKKKRGMTYFPLLPGGDGKLFMSSSLENIPVGNTVPTEHSTATPGSAQWVYMDEPLPKEIPEDLVPYWESACRSYVTDVKAVMQNLRTERILIIHHLEKFRRYLQRPDLKQEFVSQFQQDYNSILEELREDDVTKAEMHQRFDDLRERLWDICDKRREEAEEERVAVMGDGWLEDHTALLINHFATLMQAEVDRCQDTLGLLRDYYKGMYRQGLPEAGSEFTCVPLLDCANMCPSSPHPPRLCKRVSLHHTLPDCANKCPSSPHPPRLCKRVFPFTPPSQTVQTCVSLHPTLPDCANKCPPSPHPPRLCKHVSPFTPPSQTVQTCVSLHPTLPDCSVRMRVELVKSCALIKLKDLWRRAEEAFRAMEAWLGACFISEMNSIDQLAEVVRHHIESATKLQSELTLVHTDFFLNGDLMVVERPPPPPRSAPMEPWAYHTLTVPQLEAFYRQLCRVAPTGWTSADFREILQTLTSLDIDLWMPETWLVELVSMLTQDSEVLDWRQFLLSAALPWPTPTLAQLLQVLARFKTADTDARGSLTEEQYLQVELWFPSEQTKPLPEDLCEPPRYDRLANLRKFFFLLFCDPDSSPTRVDYVTLLLFFVAHPDPVQGFVRALSVVMGQPLQHHSRGRACLSLPSSRSSLMGGPGEPATTASTPMEGAQGRMKRYRTDASPSSLTHRAWSQISFSYLVNLWSRLGSSSITVPVCPQEFVKVYRELGYTAEETIPFSILSQHPVIQDLIEGSTKYQLIVSLH
uniref:Calponin-homology (CH) domain-containing protein n=1 Tax=Esox lucius TaxID=8010 RepID=A0A6Q2XHT1_ESOLU